MTVDNSGYDLDEVINKDISRTISIDCTVWIR